MEILIAVGLGAWLALSGLIASIAVFKSFKSKDKGDRR